MGFWTKKMYSSPGKLKYENQSPLFLLGSSQSNSLILKQSEEAQKVKETELGRKDIDTRTGKLDSKGMNNKEKVELETIEDKKEKNEDEKPKVNTNEEKRGNEINRSEENEDIPTKERMKLKKIKSLLKDSQLDLAELKKLTWSGIPSEHRSLIWKILMGYAPTLIERRQETINRKRKEYFDYRKRIFIKHNEINEINEMHLDVELWHQIQIDVPRTCPESELIQDKVIQKLLERLLYIWSTRHPASGYVQGINDLATPFIMVFIADYFKNGKKIQPESLTQVQLDEVESDVFWCLSKLLDGIQDNFTSAQRGIQRQLALLKYLLIKIDVKLANHLQNEQLHYVQFAFRWMNCLLMREFQLNQIIRIWDTYLSETPIGFSQFHVYVCAALLSHFSSQLLKLDFQELIMFLQNLPTKQWDTKEIEVLLSQAYLWCTIFNDAPNHLI